MVGHKGGHSLLRITLDIPCLQRTGTCCGHEANSCENRENRSSETHDGLGMYGRGVRIRYEPSKQLSEQMIESGRIGIGIIKKVQLSPIKE
jgi:hypothetical protein